MSTLSKQGIASALIIMQLCKAQATASEQPHSVVAAQQHPAGSKIVTRYL